MRLSSFFLIGSSFAAAALCSVIAAGFAADIIEDATEITVRSGLDEQDLDWTEVRADGLQVELAGLAPNEAERLRAVNVVGATVDAARIIDQMSIMPTIGLAPPHFSAEILRNDSGLSIIGLIPAATDRDALVSELNAIAGADNVTDLLEVANYPEPRGWGDAMGFSVTVLERLPRSKVSVDAGRISITAITDSAEQKRQLEDELERMSPPGLRLTLDIAAPRPVITPFTLRYIIDETGGHFDACSASTEAERDRILSVARDIGLASPATCTVGMGVPTPTWPTAVERSIKALADIGHGSITFADADITLVAMEGRDSAVFDRVVGELETALPEVFALHAVLPVPEDETAGPAEFTATLSPEGLVQLRGRVTDDGLREMANAYAKARFGSDNVYTAVRPVSALPDDWPVRVLTGIEALATLTNGVVVVGENQVSLRGVSNTEDINAVLSRLLSEKLGEAQDYQLDVTYVPPPPPTDIPPTPEECAISIQTVISEGGKITFEPGSATIDAGSLDTMNALADVLIECGELKLEIQGHTDSQGREVMNQQLSQARAQSVLNELRSRRVPTGSFTAIGYGEVQPIADNETEAGREENRRIEFHIIQPETVEDTATALEELSEQPQAAEEATE